MLIDDLGVKSVKFAYIDAVMSEACTTSDHYFICRAIWSYITSLWPRIKHIPSGPADLTWPH